MKSVCLLILTSFLVSGAHALSWHDLWFTQDQQAQKQFDAKDFKTAQKLFHREDWKAASAFRNKDYKTAAELFQKLNSQEGFYNQGNALASLHRYEEAIKAYDNALKLAPQHQDAKHNRATLQKWLAQQKKSSPSSTKQSSKTKPMQSENQTAQANTKSPNQSASPSENPSESTKQNPKTNSERNPKPSSSNAKPQSMPKKEAQSPTTPTGAQNKVSSADKTPVDGEQNQLKQQWLRLIPDDPGGFLREKFYRDYLRQQQ